MASILDQILEYKRPELEARMRDVPLTEIEKRVADAPPPLPFEDCVRSEFGLIAEIKRRSPSMAEMREANFVEAPQAYRDSTAVKAVSVLTDAHFFGMDLEWLPKVKRITGKPALRKDFIWDAYQVHEARACGADAILLMASVVGTQAGLEELRRLAEELGMAVLFEVHSEAEIERLPDKARLIGINSRNFRSSQDDYRRSRERSRQASEEGSAEVKDLSVSLDNFNLIRSLPPNPNHVKVAESGVHPGNVARVRELGFHSILAGTSLLKHPEGIRRALSEFELALA